MHIFSILQVMAVNTTPSGTHKIPSLTVVVSGSSSKRVMSVVKSTAMTYRFTISCPAMNAKLYSVVAPVSYERGITVTS